MARMGLGVEKSKANHDHWLRSKQLSPNEEGSRGLLSNHDILILFAPSSRIRSSLTLFTWKPSFSAFPVLVRTNVLPRFRRPPSGLLAHLSFCSSLPIRLPRCQSVCRSVSSFPVWTVGRLFRQLFSRPAGRVVTYSISIFWRRVVSVTLFLFKSFHFILSFVRFNLNQEWRLIFCLQ